MSSSQPQLSSSNPGSDGYKTRSDRPNDTRKAGLDFRLVSEWLRWGVILIFSSSVFYVQSTFVSRELYQADREQDRKTHEQVRSADSIRFDAMERERSVRLDRLNTTLQDLALSIRAVQADKTPAYLTERLQNLERDLNETRRILQELSGIISVLRQTHMEAL